MEEGAPNNEYEKSFKRAVSWTLGSTNTGLSVSSVFVGEGELSEISADHIKFDFDNIEGLSIVNSYEAADHFGHDDSVSQVSLDGNWLLTWGSVGLSLLALQVQSVVSVLDF